MTKYWWRIISVGLKQVKDVTDIKISVTNIQKLSPRSSHQHLFSKQEQVPFMIVNLIFVFSTFDLVELGYLAKEGFQIRITCNNKGLNKFEIRYFKYLSKPTKDDGKLFSSILWIRIHWLWFHQSTIFFDFWHSLRQLSCTMLFINFWEYFIIQDSNHHH